MRNVGIIAEFNPFHNGHAYLIESVREEAGDDACIVAIMSGDFVQRGQPAVFDKWKRAEAAVSCGVDLVLELPVWAACSGAETFAEGGVGLLEKAGNIDYLAFGAEADSLSGLDALASVFADETEEFSAALKAGLAEGMSYAKARSDAAESVCPGAGEILGGPNNILAVEYLKQLRKQGSAIKPMMVRRKAAGYFGIDESACFAGAGRLREMLMDGESLEAIRKYIPENSYNVIKNEKPLFMEDAYKYIIYRLITMPAEEASQIDGAVEGLENRALKAALAAIDYESLLDGIKTKRYSRTAVERLLVRMLLGITREDMAGFRQADRVCALALAFNRRGAAYLRSIKENEKIKIITNISKEWPEDGVPAKSAALDVKAAQIYTVTGGGCAGDEMKKHGILKE